MREKEGQGQQSAVTLSTQVYPIVSSTPLLTMVTKGLPLVEAALNHLNNDMFSIFSKPFKSQFKALT